jgi:hypothetical protein
MPPAPSDEFSYRRWQAGVDGLADNADIGSERPRSRRHCGRSVIDPADGETDPAWERLAAAADDDPLVPGMTESELAGNYARWDRESRGQWAEEQAWGRAAAAEEAREARRRP